MNRREFIRGAGAVGAGTVGVASVHSPAIAQKRVPRQAVVLITDTVRRDMLNCYRNTGLKTPNLDRLAAAGIRFERAYTCQPVCAAARSALFTGLYPHTNDVWGNSMPLAETTHTVGQRLTDRNVHCAYIGKWHLDGVDYFGTGRAAPGWDPSYWYDQRDYLQELSPEDRLRSRQVATSRDPNLKAEFTFGHRCSSRAVDFIAKHKDEDFLLVVSYDEPHDPSICPRPYSDMYTDFNFPLSPNADDPLIDKPEEQRVWADGRLCERPRPIHSPHFFGCLTFIDSEIGRVVDEIDRSTPGALVMYTSDHGDALESHRLNGKGPAMYEEITGIPLLVRWKGHAPANSVSTHPVSHIDVSGTLMEFFGHSVPKTLEGSSMLRTFEDPKVPARKQVFIEFGRYEVDHDGFGGFQPIRCVCNGRYKLAIHLLTGDELYDLETDPGEMTNLIDSSEHAIERNELHDTLLDWMNRTRDPFRGYYWGNRPWRRQFPISWDNFGMTRQRESDGYLPRELDYTTGLPMTSATRKK